MTERQLKKTADGSDTLYVPAIDECYHSTNGAVQESRHIFIEAGFKLCSKKHIQVLEIGFGTGLNAFLTLLETEYLASDITVNYTTVELYPIETKDALVLNYPELIDSSKRSYFEKLHDCEWNKAIAISDRFTLIKLQANFTEIDFEQQFDVFYFDAFSPEKQPEMWSEEMFSKLYYNAEKNAVLTTYCAKGAVRRVMKTAGFTVERLPGPPGKREILRGIKLVSS